MAGKFISFEGPEGGGKSSVCREVLGVFKHIDIQVVREPGSTSVGEKIRTILQTEDMPDMSELMLFEAARASIVDMVIRPTLFAGTSIICDRFYDSTTAYQGYGRGGNLRDIAMLNSMATKGVSPDLTIVFDIDPAVGMQRKGKPSDRIESAGADFHLRVRKGFLEIADLNPRRVKVIDASRPLVEVVESVARLCEEHLGWSRNKEA